MFLILNPSAIEGLFHAEGGMVDMALRTRAELVATAAKRLCPVDTGRLRASIEVIPGKDEKGVVCLVGTNVVYGIYQEFGTRFQSGTPFLRPALYGADPGVWPTFEEAA